MNSTTTLIRASSLKMDILQHTWTAYNRWAEGLSPHWVFFFARAGLLFAIPMILCAIADKATGRLPSAGAWGLFLLGGLVAIAVPLDPHTWDPSINSWFVVLAVFSVLIIPGKLALFLSEHDERQSAIALDLYLGIIVLFIVNLLTHL